MVRLLYVEDDPLLRTYVSARLALDPGIQVVGAVPDASAALSLLAENPVEVVLLDYQLEGADGMQLLGLLCPAEPPPGESRRPARVLFCTGYADAQFEAEAREMGAAGVISKTRMATDLIPAVRAVAAGGEWFETAARAAVGG